MLCMPKVLLLTRDENEARSLQEILGNYARLVRARGLLEAESHLEKGNCNVLFCSWAFYRAFWNGALQEMCDRYPALPVVVLSHTGGEREWLEVLEVGAFDLLALPCEKPALVALVKQAVVSNQARKVQRFEGNQFCVIAHQSRPTIPRHHQYCEPPWFAFHLRRNMQPDAFRRGLIASNCVAIRGARKNPVSGQSSMEA